MTAVGALRAAAQASLLLALLLLLPLPCAAGPNDPVPPPSFVRSWHQDLPGVPGAVAAGAEFGHALAVADFDCDGFDDAAIGIPYHDRVEFDGVSFEIFTDAGAVLLLFGGPAGLQAADAKLIVPSEPAGSEVGFALAAGPAGFFTSTCDDLLIGAPGWANDSGRVAWLSIDEGDRSALLSVFSSQGAYGGAEASEQGDRFGEAVAMAPLNDSAWGAAIGAPGEDIGGAVDAGHVVRGSASGWFGLNQNNLGFGNFVESGDQFGAALAIGDVNADGFGDLVVGVPFEDGPASRSGEVDVFYGESGGLSVVTDAFDGDDMNGFGAHADGFFGRGLAARSEGLHRLAIGAPGDYRSVTRAGVLYVCVNVNDPALCGSNLDKDGDDFDIAQPFDRLGGAIAFGYFPVPDMHALAVGIPGHSGTAGAVGLLLMQQGTALLGTAALLDQASLGHANASDDRFGRALASGNFNGRGADELLLAAPRKDVTTTSGTAADAGLFYELSWDAGYPDPLFANGFE